MPNIGVVGAGVGGLHLSLLLQQRGVPVTLYADRGPEELRQQPRLVNTAGHWEGTRRRERELGIAHWDDDVQPIVRMKVDVGGPRPMRFEAGFDVGPAAIDYRIMMPRLLEDFVARGGEVVRGAVTREQLEDLALRHDLVVVSSGRGSMTELFPKDEARSPFARPQRLIQISVVDGTDVGDGSVNYELVPGVGELLTFPYLTDEGVFQIMYVSAAVDGPLPPLMNADLAGSASREGLERVFRDVVGGWFPASDARVDWDRFRTLGPRYDIAGAITPTVRRPYARLDNGRWVLAIGDVHTVNDPVLGQGANAASASAFIVGDAIAEDPFGFDELWCQRVATRIWERSGAAVNFTNAILAVPPRPQVVQLLAAASVSPPVAETVARCFGRPRLAWSILDSEARTREAIAQIGGPETLRAVDAALADAAAA